MDEPLWLRGAAVAAALAGLGPDDAAGGFDRADGAAVAQLVRGLAAPEDRAAAARAIAHERVRLGARGAVEPDAGTSVLGALVLAAVLRALAPRERATVARAFEPAGVRRAAELAASAPACDGPALHTLLSRMAARHGRAPTAHELGALAEAALGRSDARAPAAVHATLRSARALAIDLAGLFAPFRPAMEERQRQG